jgi:hypothetical protein
VPCGLRPGRGPWKLCHGVDTTDDTTDDATDDTTDDTNAHSNSDTDTTTGRRRRTASGRCRTAASVR